MGTGVEFLLLEEAAMLGIGEFVGAATAAEAVGAVGAAAASAGGVGGGAAAVAGGAEGLGATLKSALPYINAGTGLASLATTLGAEKPTGIGAPALTDPTAMPEQFSMNKDVNAARRASIAEQMRRRGRASTNLTDQSSEKLG